MHSIATWWLWTGFFAFILCMLAIDICLLAKNPRGITGRKALIWTLIWFALAMFFNILLWGYLVKTQNAAIAHQKALEFFTGYIIEETLSVDNMFAFLLIFNYFTVPHKLQRRVLLYGVIGAVVLRLIMILFGTWLIYKLHWILYFFGVFLVISGIKMLFITHENSLEDNLVLNWLRRHIRITKSFHAERFFIKHNLLWYATPLFLVLVLIEISDLIFALDSIPAIFAITRDPFIIFTSNIFAILGLRALYFLLAHQAARLHLLKYGVAMILVFIGAKMLLEPWLVIPIPLSLSVVIAILGATFIINSYSR
ncbi:MAG: TerC family protein [Gammaproteobacteria bacterium]